MKNVITDEDIERLMDESEMLASTAGNKTTIVVVTLKNGFVLTESSSCVDPLNYDKTIGIRTALKKIRSRLWELEGYRLQQAIYEEKESASSEV